MTVPSRRPPIVTCWIWARPWMVAWAFSLAAAGIFPALVWVLYPARRESIWLYVVLAAVIIWMHRANLRRLAAGTENRFERARILGITVAELLRESSLGRPLPRRHQPDPIASDQWVELGRLAANLNQLQRAINRGQAEDVPVALVEELRCLLHEVRQALVGKAGAA